jgi:hypothetical protein
MFPTLGTLPEVEAMPMPSNPSLAELLLHPIRWRIAQALIGRSLTTAELHEALPDVPTTSLYRQVATLVGAGVLTVVDERRVRGTVERTYALDTGAADDEAGTRDPDRLRTMFTVFFAGLAGDFERYLGRPELDPVRDGVAFRQNALLLTDDELQALLARVQEALAPFVGNEPAPGRTRRVLSTVLIPGE